MNGVINWEDQNIGSSDGLIDGFRSIRSVIPPMYDSQPTGLYDKNRVVKDGGIVRGNMSYPTLREELSSADQSRGLVLMFVGNTGDTEIGQRPLPGHTVNNHV